MTVNRTKNLILTQSEVGIELVMLIERHSLENPGVTRELCLAPSGGTAHSQTPERGQGELSKFFSQVLRFTISVLLILIFYAVETTTTVYLLNVVGGITPSRYNPQIAVIVEKDVFQLPPDGEWTESLIQLLCHR